MKQEIMQEDPKMKKTYLLLLVAALLEMYTMHRISSELKDEK